MAKIEIDLRDYIQEFLENNLEDEFEDYHIDDEVIPILVIETSTIVNVESFKVLTNEESEHKRKYPM